MYKVSLDKVMIFPTMQCNFNCRHCGWKNLHDNSIITPVDIEKLKSLNLLDEFKWVGSPRIYAGGGEPTLNIDTIKNMEIMIGDPQRISIITNGWFLNSVDDIYTVGKSLMDLYPAAKSPVASIYISQNIYHQEQRHEASHVDAYNKVKKFHQMFPHIKVYIIPSGANGYYKPFGNALINDIPINDKSIECYRLNKDTNEIYWAPVLTSGLNLYPCCSGQSEPIGNLYDDSIDVIKFRYAALYEKIKDYGDSIEKCYKCTELIKDIKMAKKIYIANSSTLSV